MGPDLEMEGKPNIMMEVSDAKQSNGSVSQDPQNKVMHCVNNIDDNISHKGAFDGKVKVENGGEDVEVNISECTVSSDRGLVENECQGTTENSSSFGNSFSGNQNVSTLGDVEVESPFCGGDALFDGANGDWRMRKKKLTDHWRRFIHPIMWRCKWIELQIKEFHSQALKYDRELAEYDQRKKLEFEKLTVEGINAKSIPFAHQFQRNQVMKRKKRKRVEETTDLASYMSQHHLFSYRDYRRSVADGAFVENDLGNFDNKTANGNDGFEFNDDWPLNEVRDGENYLEHTLSKIEVLQSQVRQLKSRVDKVMSENPGKFCSINRLSLLVPCESVPSSDQHAASSSHQHSSSPPKVGNPRQDRSQSISSWHISECNMEDPITPGSALLSHREFTPFPDMIELTDVSQIGALCKINKEGILIHDPTSEEDLQNFQRLMSQFTEKPQVSGRKLNDSHPVMAPEADSPMQTSMPHGQPSSSRTNVLNSKRKRGKRKSRLG